jgi:outer membrane immunogenic protein
MKSMMIRTGFAAAALLLAPLAALAADLPYKAQPGYVPQPAYANWTGIYAGLNAGYGFGKSNWDIPAVSTSPKGALAGLTAGYNFQTGTWVWGAEGDIDYSGMKGSTACTSGAGTCETKNSWLGTARARLGYAGWNNWLPYITGGAAIGDIKADNGVNSASKTRLGWTAGLGVEYAMLSSWSVKLEYLYVDLGKFDVNSGAGTPDDVSLKANLVRLGVNYRF